MILYAIVKKDIIQIQINIFLNKKIIQILQTNLFLKKSFIMKVEDKIEQLFPISPVMEPLKIDGKKYTFDLSFKDEKNRFVCGLIQNHYEENFLKKCYYYACRRQIYELDFEIDLNKVEPLILIAVVNFKIFDNNNNHINILDLYNEDKSIKMNNIKFIFIEIPKFHLDVVDRRGFEWCKYLAYGDQKESNDKNVKHAQKIYRFYNRME